MAPIPPTTAPSEARILANRENARKSTGPRTAAGKAASRGNAMKHGLSARMLLRYDDQGLHRELLADLYHRYQPVTAAERIVVCRIAFDLVRLDALVAAYIAPPDPAGDTPEPSAAALDFPAGIFTAAAGKQPLFALLS